MATRKPTYLNTREAAAHLGLSHRTLESYRVKGGGPPFLTYCNRIHYLCRDLNAWAVKSRRRLTSEGPVKDRRRTGSSGGSGRRAKPAECLPAEEAGDDFLSEDELAALLKVSTRTLARYRELGQESAFETGSDGQVLYRRAVVEAWLASDRRSSTTDPGETDSDDADSDTSPCSPESE